MSVGKRLLEIRKQQGKTQAQFAKYLGVSTRAYTTYELDERDLPLPLMLKLHEDIEIDINWLVIGKGASKSVELEEAVKTAVSVCRGFFYKSAVTPKPEQEAAIVWFLVQSIIRDGGFDEDKISAYLKSLNH